MVIGARVPDRNGRDSRVSGICYTQSRDGAGRQLERWRDSDAEQRQQRAERGRYLKEYIIWRREYSGAFVNRPLLLRCRGAKTEENKKRLQVHSSSCSRRTSVFAEVAPPYVARGLDSDMNPLLGLSLEE